MRSTYWVTSRLGRRQCASTSAEASATQSSVVSAVKPVRDVFGWIEVGHRAPPQTGDFKKREGAGHQGLAPLWECATKERRRRPVRLAH